MHESLQSPIGKLQVSWLAWLFRQTSGSLAFINVDGDDYPVINGRQLARDEIESVEAVSGLFWTDVIVRCIDGTQNKVLGLRTMTAKLASDRIRIYSAARLAEILLDDFDQPGGERVYLGFKVFDQWMVRARSVAVAGRPVHLRDRISSSDFNFVDRLVRIVERGEVARAARNTEFVAAERVIFRDRFDKIQGYPLNDDQINAVLYNEDSALVVAGAGTGKTSTIIAKVDYLLAAGLACADELLLLAFTNKAADEMRTRLQQITGQDLSVQTFHALGLQVYSESHGQRPHLSRLCDDERKLGQALRSYVDAMLADVATRDQVIEFLAFHRYPTRPDEDFKSEHEKHQYAKGFDLRDLRGTQMKSVQETVIANWLYLNGIEYEYERDYEHPTGSVQYRQYRPDFYLPTCGIYIEHFGIDRAGNPPKFFSDPVKYCEGIRWKRHLHKAKGTKLIETYSFQAFEGTLLVSLDGALREHGVRPQPVPPGAAVALVSRDEVLPPFVDVMKTFLKLFKGNAWTIAQVRARVEKSGDYRARAFLVLFEGVYQRYQAALMAERAIDFDDMIVESARLVESGRWSSGYRYVIVDEFQDISAGRAKLLKSLLAQVEDSKLFCVGDDWQSIYRFTGSDIDLMTKFGEHFGRFRRTDLRQTHRFGSNLLTASSRFVMANPQQLKKELIATHHDDGAAIEVCSGTPSKDEPMDLAEVYARIQRDAESRPPAIGDVIKVFLLGRYKFVVDHYHAANRFPGMCIRSMTSHAAKGLECDYAIVLDVVGGRYGFPTEIVDDPLLDLVLAAQATFPHAEERRLFYVALTRSRRKTYLVTHDSRRSVFVDELESQTFKGLVIASGAAKRSALCPKCNGGRLEKREGRFGGFYGCSNYPVCNGTAVVCPDCGVGAFVKIGREFVCHNLDCGGRRNACPSCGIGYMKLKQGRYGAFLGCSEWRQDSSRGSCTNTIKA